MNLAINHSLKIELNTLNKMLLSLSITKPLSFTAEESFKEFSLEEKLQAHQKIGALIRLLKGFGDEKFGSSVERDKRLTFHFLQKYRLSLLDLDFLEVLEDGDIVEICTLEHQHIFASLGFFELCNYDIETLFLHPWPKLFRRDVNVEGCMLDLAHQLSAARIGALDNPPIPEHTVFECFKGLTDAYRYKLRRVGCLANELAKVNAYISIIRVEKIPKGLNLQS